MISYTDASLSRDLGRSLLRTALIGLLLATGIAFGLMRLAARTVRHAEHQAAQQDIDAREAAIEQLSRLHTDAQTCDNERQQLESQIESVAEDEREAFKKQLAEKIKERDDLAKRYNRLRKIEARLGNKELPEDLPKTLKF